jgi:hypothetical protein
VRKAELIILLTAVPIAQAGVRIMDVDVYRNVNGWTPQGQQGYVTQTFINTADSIVWADWFVGAANSGGAYEMEVRTLDGLVLYEGEAPSDPDTNYTYVRADLTHVFGAPSLIKGKTYVLKVYHSGGEPINYYSDPTNPYPYGYCIVGGQDQPGYDLACRIEGANAPVSSDFFGVNGVVAWLDSVLLDSMLTIMTDAGIKWNREYICWFAMEDSNRTLDTIEFDRILRREQAHGIKALLCLTTAPTWAITNTLPESLNEYPPQHLDRPVVIADTGVNPDHWWAYWVYRIVKQAVSMVGDTGFVVEIGNELNYWRAPKRGYDSFPDHETVAFRESLYALLCDAACQAAHRADPDVKVVIGGLGGVFLNSEQAGGDDLTSGKDWLSGYYANRGPEPTNAGVSVHPYQYPPVQGLPDKRDNSKAFTPDTFARDLDTMRNLMKTHDDGDKLLIATELGWHSGWQFEHVQRAALSIPEAHVFAMAGDPNNFLDCIYWFVHYNVGFTNWQSSYAGRLLHVSSVPDGSWTILRLPTYYSYQQMTNELLGKRLNGRVLTGIHTKDTCSYLYEFEDPATQKKRWIGWRNWELPEGGPAPVAVRIPARTNQVNVAELKREAVGVTYPLESGTDGWLQIALDTVPRYVHETGDTFRPDLKVESLWTMPQAPRTGEQVRLYARLKNQGNAGTPPDLDTNLTAWFYANGTPIGWRHGLPVIQPESSVTCSTEGHWTPTLPGSYLLKVLANPKVFMELEFDDNEAYLMKDVSCTTAKDDNLA